MTIVAQAPTTSRPRAGDMETRSASAEVTLEVTADGRRLRGVIPYNVESRDLGGWREVIEPGALRAANLADLIATVDHVGVPLGRYPTTLTIEDRSDGLYWTVDPPASRADIREAVERGDLRAGSWRMVVGREEWRGDVRHIHEITHLRDVAVVTNPAYAGAVVEFRSEPDPQMTTKENHVTSTETPEATEAADTTSTTEQSASTATTTTGTLRVEDRAMTMRPAYRPLARAFRDNGFPGETATVDFGEFRAATFSGSLDTLQSPRVIGVDLGMDSRYVWPVMPLVNVAAGDTSVQVLRQSARTLPSAASIIRAIDAVTAKPEVGSELAIVTTALKQVAAIETNIPNVYLEQAAFNSVIETDLRLALNEGLDKLVLDAVALSGFQAPGTDPLLISIRKAMTTILAAGYNPDTVVLTPANAEALDTLRSDGTEKIYVFGPAELAPKTIYGLTVRISKTAAAPVVMDSTSLGKLYVSPITLARFEVDAGATNRSNVRLEGHGVFGTERQTAAVRIAAA